MLKTNILRHFKLSLICLVLVQVPFQLSWGKPFYLDKLSLTDAQVQANKALVKKNLGKVDPAKAEIIAAYLASIGLTPNKPNFRFQLNRILKSSKQFIFCEDVENWECLETEESVYPKSIMRQDSLPGLGKPLLAGESLDIEFYFTTGWYDNYIANNNDFIIPEKTVAEIMAEKIKEHGEKKIWMALYGIDDIQDTMSSVFNAIKDKVLSGVATYAVLDVSDEQQANSFPRDYNILKMQNGKYILGHRKIDLDYSYVSQLDNGNSAFSAPAWAKMYLTDIAELSKTKSKFELRKFLLADFFEKPMSTTKIFDLQVADLTWIALNHDLNNFENNLSRITFQYQNSLDIIRLLNAGISQNEESKARIEFPFRGIMHNKFLVFEKNNGQRSVWTGTTNVARTCMGDESNSNLAILIKNTPIANAFLDEFNEMFSVEAPSKSKPASLLTGSFHARKRPNTHRYFTFLDQTEVRVHFSPTDDAEHRVLLPLIYSARTGDILRISMFGGGGYELVRAMQWAVARGVDIRIVLDNLTGSSASSWWKSVDANLLQPNPYPTSAEGGRVQIRKNNWSGLNHHKTATLTRKLADGTYKPEVLVVGSQNWSQTGNDVNDENMVTIRNKAKSLPIFEAFNDEFDVKLWPSSSAVEQAKPLNF